MRYRDHDKRRQRYDYLANAEAFRNKQANKQPMTQADPTEVADWLLTAPFSILGHDADTIFILPEVSGVVQRIRLNSLFQESTLRLLTKGIGFWLDSPFVTRNKDGKVTGVDWKAAGQEIADRRDQLTIYDPQVVRGRGCWIDEGQPVMHLGNHLLTLKGAQSLSNNSSRFCYPKGRVMPGPTKPLTDEEALAIANLLQRFPFEEESMRFWLQGWIVSAMVCGALPWRPNAWLTGGRGTGKTTLLERYVSPLLAAVAPVVTQASTTEAACAKPSSTMLCQSFLMRSRRNPASPKAD